MKTILVMVIAKDDELVYLGPSNSLLSTTSTNFARRQSPLKPDREFRFRIAKGSAILQFAAFALSFPFMSKYYHLRIVLVTSFLERAGGKMAQFLAVLTD